MGSVDFEGESAPQGHSYGGRRERVTEELNEDALCTIYVGKLPSNIRTDAELLAAFKVPLERAGLGETAVASVPRKGAYDGFGFIRVPEQHDLKEALYHIEEYRKTPDGEHLGSTIINPAKSNAPRRRVDGETDGRRSDDRPRGDRSRGGYRRSDDRTGARPRRSGDDSYTESNNAITAMISYKTNADQLGAILKDNGFPVGATHSRPNSGRVRFELTDPSRRDELVQYLHGRKVDEFTVRARPARIYATAKPSEIAAE